MGDGKKWAASARVLRHTGSAERDDTLSVTLVLGVQLRYTYLRLVHGQGGLSSEAERRGSY